MLRVLHAILEVTWHRRGPDGLPASKFLLGLVLTVYAVVGWLTQGLAPPIAHPILFLVTDISIDVAFIWSLLRAFGHERRFLQTAIAFFGVHTLFNLIGVPPLLWYGSLQPQQPEAAFPTVLITLVVIWTIDVSGFVIARALSRPYVVGVAIMLGYGLLSLSLRDTLFPPLLPGK